MFLWTLLNIYSSQNKRKYVYQRITAKDKVRHPIEYLFFKEQQKQKVGRRLPGTLLAV